MARPSNTDVRREQITLALERVMARKGYDGASIGDVAREAGLASGLVHYHFANKLEILLAVIARLAASHGEGLDRALAAAGGDPVVELGAFIDAHLALGPGADPDALACWIMLSGEALREQRVREAYARVLETITGRLVEIIRRGVRARLFRTSGEEAAAAGIVAAIQGYYLLGATARALIPRGTAAHTTKVMAAGLLGLEQPARRRGGHA